MLSRVAQSCGLTRSWDKSASVMICGATGWDGNAAASAVRGRTRWHATSGTAGGGGGGGGGRTEEASEASASIHREMSSRQINECALLAARRTAHRVQVDPQQQRREDEEHGPHGGDDHREERGPVASAGARARVAAGRDRRRGEQRVLLCWYRPAPVQLQAVSATDDFLGRKDLKGRRAPGHLRTRVVARRVAYSDASRSAGVVQGWRLRRRSRRVLPRARLRRETGAYPPGAAPSIIGWMDP